MSRISEKRTTYNIKNELSQYRHIKYELQLLRSQLRELAALREAAAALKEKEYSESDTVDFDVRISKLETSIKTRMDELLSKYERIEHYIEAIDIPFIRSAMKHRFLYGKTWQQTAFALGEYDEQYARKRCERYMKLNGQL
ncbi:MAG: hypothetical protein WBI55_09300 [Eubacteriales bacterium]|nr:hypothetical protein [Clostridiales bacterium]